MPVCRQHGEHETVRCRDCMARYRARARSDGRLALAERRQHLKHTYGLTLEDFDAMVEQQGGRCAICHRVPPYRLCVDHDHEDGRVRGLLCVRCNSALGVFERNRQGFADYLGGLR